MFLIQSQSFSCAAQHTFWYRSCFKALPTYIHLWSEVHLSQNNEDRSHIFRLQKKQAWLTMVVSFVALLLCEATSMYYILDTRLMEDMIMPLERHHTFFIPGLILIFLVLLFQNASWIIPVIVYLMLSSNITNCFTNLNNEVKKSIATANATKVLPGNYYLTAIMSKSCKSTLHMLCYY